MCRLEPSTLWLKVQNTTVPHCNPFSVFISQSQLEEQTAIVLYYRPYTLTRNQQVGTSKLEWMKEKGNKRRGLREGGLPSSSGIKCVTLYPNEKPISVESLQCNHHYSETKYTDREFAKIRWKNFVEKEELIYLVLSAMVLVNKTLNKLGAETAWPLVLFGSFTLPERAFRE